MAENIEQRYSLPEESAISAGFVRLRPKVYVWVPLLFVASFVIVTVGSRRNAFLPSLGLAAVIWAFYFCVVWLQPFEGMRTSAFAMGYRFGVHKAASLIGMNTYAAHTAEAGEQATAANRKAAKPEIVKHIGKVSFVPFVTEVGSTQLPIGMVVDRRYKTHSAVLTVNSASQLIAEPGKDGKELLGLEQLLAELSSTEMFIHRLTWRDQTLFGEYQEPDSLLDTLRKGAGLQDQADLPHTSLVKRRIAEMAGAAVIHNTTMVLTVHEPQLHGVRKKYGGFPQALYQQLVTFYASAMGNGNTPSPLGWRSAGALSYSQLLWENRLALDPVFAKPYWDRYHQDGSLPAPPEVTAWPMTADFTDISYCRLGDTYHKGFYVQRYPDSGLSLEQIWELRKVKVPKTITVVIEMVPAHIAQRYAGWRANGLFGTQSDRKAAGRRITAVEELESTEMLAHERAIAMRNQVGRLRCYVDVTGSSLEAVTANAKEFCKAGFPSGCVIEPLTGRQSLGIEASMPYGRGLAGWSRKWNI